MKLKQLTIIFVIKSLSNFSYVSSAIQALGDQHKIHLFFDKHRSKRESSETVDTFLSLNPHVTADWMQCRTGISRKLIFLIREIRTCVSYLKRKHGSRYYKTRWLSYIPSILRPFTYLLKPFYDIFEVLEDCTLSSTNIMQQLLELKPDVVVATPANHRFSEEIEYVKTAKSLGIPTVIMNHSWDNLTTKGIFHIIPDKLLVWNKTQAYYARTIHGIPDKNIEVVGAPFFDKWFEHDTTEYISAKIGLDPSQPYCLYLGSSANIAEDETWLIQKIARHYPQVLVRPHPANYKNYLWLKEKNVVVYPRNGKLPDDAQSQHNLRMMIEQSAFVFGINTSAMIDAVILNKPCLTLITNKYNNTQIETLHFRAMYSSMYVCRKFKDLLKQIKELETDDKYKPRREQFVSENIRPLGGNTPAGWHAANAILRQAGGNT